MSQSKLHQRHLQHLNGVLRMELTAVHQQFTHILTLQSWEEEEIAERIISVDNVDFPNSLRIVNHMVEMGAIPKLSDDERSFVAHLPHPGTSRKNIISAELALERRLSNAIKLAQKGLADSDNRTAKTLISDALAPRKPYATWLEQQLASDNDAVEPPVQPFGNATAELNAFFGQLIVVIEQALVHAFVHWHASEKSLANAAWATSGAAMMQATAITNLFAAHRSAPNPTDAAASDVLEAPRIGTTAEEALAFGRTLAHQCQLAAEHASKSLDGTEAGPMFGEFVTYYRNLGDWLPQQDHPATNNPAAFHSFERTLQKYVW